MALGLALVRLPLGRMPAQPHRVGHAHNDQDADVELELPQDGKEVGEHRRRRAPENEETDARQEPEAVVRPCSRRASPACRPRQP